jgi:hypothetical protein
MRQGEIELPKENAGLLNCIVVLVPLMLMLLLAIVGLVNVPVITT